MPNINVTPTVQLFASTLLRCLARSQLFDAILEDTGCKKFFYFRSSPEITY